jgi:hypothetical protein
VWPQLYHLSLQWSPVSHRMWILEIKSGEIITWDMLTIVRHTLRTTGPDLWNTCPTRHLKMQSSMDTCVCVCVTKNHNEFERQPILRDFLQSTVRMHFLSPLRRYRFYSWTKKTFMGRGWDRCFIREHRNIRTWDNRFTVSTFCNLLHVWRVVKTTLLKKLKVVLFSSKVGTSKM